MTSTFLLADAATLADFRLFVSRSVRVNETAIRLAASNKTLVAYTAVLAPRSLLDNAVTVLGLRTFALDVPAVFDVAVSPKALLEHLDRAAPLQSSSPSETPSRAKWPPQPESPLPFELSGPVNRQQPLAVRRVEIPLPPTVIDASWAGISAPRTGWVAVQPIDGRVLESAALSGIERISQLLPAQAGRQRVHTIRSEVWGEPIPEHPTIAAGAAFAALSLGFLHAHDPWHVFRSDRWMRLSNTRGHVIIRSAS